MVFVQQAGVPLPLPVGVVLLIAGYRAASQPPTTLLLTLLIDETAMVLGASIKYWFGLKGGRPLLALYGRRLGRAEELLHRGGSKAVALSQLIPGVSVIVPLVAGAVGMPFRRFLPPLVVGTAVYTAGLIAVGFWAGPTALARLVALGFSVRLIAILALAATVGALLQALRRRARAYRRVPFVPGPEENRTEGVRRSEDSRASGPSVRFAEPHQVGPLERALLAGMVAMFEMGLAVNIALYVFAAWGLLLPERALLRFMALVMAQVPGGSEGLLIGLIVVFVAGGLLWSFIYTHIAAPLLPGPPVVRGLLFSLLPFTASMCLLLLAGAGPLGLGLGAGLIPLVGEAFRCAVFGAGLGTAEALVRHDMPRALLAEGAEATVPDLSVGR
jgi:membrane protein DedA with SNARE-associated domain